MIHSLKNNFHYSYKTLCKLLYMDKIGKTLFLLELATLTGKKAFKIKQMYDNTFAEFYYKLLH